jgi:type VI secretion system secreted protein Hcp
MLIEIRYRDKGGISHAGGKDPILGVKLGSEVLTPKNINFKIQSISPRDAASGLATGKRQHEPLTITKEYNPATPNLLSAGWTNEVISNITLNFWGTNAQGKPESNHYTITLTNAQVTSYKRYNPVGSVSHASSHSNELEEFQLTFQKIEISFVQFKKSSSDDWTA